MLDAPIPPNEEERLKSLRSLKLLDTAAEERFDRITKIAQQLFEVPSSTISLVDNDREWFKSSQGMDVSEGPRNISFCGHAMLADDLFVIPDTLLDPRFCDNPMVVNKPFVRFYAGQSLLGPGGHKIGTFCIKDNKPRHFPPEKLKLLKDLGTWVEMELNSQQLSAALNDRRENEKSLNLLIEELKKAQHVLKENEMHYRQVIDAISDMILVKGPQSRIVWGNKAFRDYYGMTNEQLNDVIDAPFNLPDFTQKYIKDDEFVFHSGQVLDIPEELVVRHDLQVRSFHTVKSPIFDESGKVKMTVAVCRDITDRKKHEEELRQAHNQVMHNEKLASIGQLSAGIGHEIKNPLAIILLSIEEFEARIAKEDSHNIMLVRMIKKAATRANDIVQKLLNFSRLADLEMIPMELDKAIEDAISLSQNSTKLKDIEIELKLDPNIKTIHADKIAIEQIMVNLITNAADAIEHNGKISIRTYYKNTADKEVVIEVSDNGSGMPPEITKRIFEPFFTTKDQGKGTGLGLSTVYSLVKSHDGDIELESTVGAGTTFRIILPQLENGTEKSPIDEL